jgi:hypothetical protein
VRLSTTSFSDAVSIESLQLSETVEYGAAGYIMYAYFSVRSKTPRIRP